MSNDRKPNFAIPGVLLLVAMAVGVFTETIPLDLKRPVSKIPRPLLEETSESVPSRLWEDPLKAYARAAAAGGWESPPGIPVPVPVALPEPGGLLGLDDGLVDPSTAGSPPFRLNDRWLVLTVTIPGGSYEDNSENRKRTRYAALAALSSKHYRPADSGHLGAFQLYHDTAGESGGEPKGSIAVPFEIFEHEPSSAEEPGDDPPAEGRRFAKKVLLIWLPEEALGRHPLVALHGILDGLSAHLAEKGSDPPAHQIIGPTSSNGLVALLEDDGAWDVDVARPCAPPATTGKDTHSSSAQASSAQAKEDGAEEDGTKVAAGGSSGVESGEEEEPQGPGDAGEATSRDGGSAESSDESQASPRIVVSPWCLWAGLPWPPRLDLPEPVAPDEKPVAQTDVDSEAEDTVAPAKVPCVLEGVRMLNTWATIGNDDLEKLVTSTFVHTARRLRLPRSGLVVERVVGTDDALVTALVRELARRGIDPENDPIALITEWDTYYGRSFFDALKRGSGSGKNVTRYPYLQGIDGTIPSADNRFNDDPVAGQRAAGEDEMADRPLGRRQTDYLRRLSSTVANPPVAIGVIATDVYDTLLILRALRTRFPKALFFTTDLDVRLLDAKENEWTRNLLVASHFGLEPGIVADEEDGSRGFGVLPFRDSYQTANFEACSYALDQAGRRPEAASSDGEETTRPAPEEEERRESSLFSRETLAKEKETESEPSEGSVASKGAESPTSPEESDGSAEPEGSEEPADEAVLEVTKTAPTFEHEVRLYEVGRTGAFLLETTNEKQVAWISDVPFVGHLIAPVFGQAVRTRDKFTTLDLHDWFLVAIVPLTLLALIGGSWISLESITLGDRTVRFIRFTGWCAGGLAALFLVGLGHHWVTHGTPLLEISSWLAFFFVLTAALYRTYTLVQHRRKLIGRFPLLAEAYVVGLPLVCTLILGLEAFMLANWLFLAGEPVAFLEGISIWPAVGIRMVVTCAAFWGLHFLSLRLDQREEEIGAAFELSPGGEGDEHRDDASVLLTIWTFLTNPERFYAKNKAPSRNPFVWAWYWARMTFDALVTLLFTVEQRGALPLEPLRGDGQKHSLRLAVVPGLRAPAPASQPALVPALHGSGLLRLPARRPAARADPRRLRPFRERRHLVGEPEPLRRAPALRHGRHAALLQLHPAALARRPGRAVAAEGPEPPRVDLRRSPVEGERRGGGRRL